MTANKKSKALYICYFGLREPLVQTQVLPYLLEIMKDGVNMSLLTFEPDLKSTWTLEEIAAARRQLSEKRIDWHYLPYHKRPSAPATFYDILNGARKVRQLISRQKFDILHCRIHVPALMAATARKFSSKKPKILFDIRGFFPEEYTDAGIWPENGWLFRAAKRAEKWLLNEADGFVVLTEKAREILFPEISSHDNNLAVSDRRGRPVEVIPCCVDLKRFEIADELLRTETRRKLAINDRFVIAYVGSFGGWYLSDEMFEFFAAAREVDPSVFILILTQRQTEAAVEKLKVIGFEDGDFFVGSVSPGEIPDYLNAADAAISFIKRCYSKQASSPTKNAEYLAAGLPMIVNPGIGDVDSLIGEDGVGVLVEAFDHENYAEALIQLKALGDVRKRCRESAQTRFDLVNVGGKRYRRLYKTILGE